MQISEMKLFQISKVCNFLKKLSIDILYFADSLGSLNSKPLKKL